MKRKVKTIKLIQVSDITECPTLKVLTSLKDGFCSEVLSEDCIFEIDMTGIDLIIPSVANLLVKNAYKQKVLGHPTIFTEVSKEVVLSLQHAIAYTSLPISFWVLDHKKESFLAGEVRPKLLDILNKMMYKTNGASTEEIASLTGIKTANASVQLNFLYTEGLIDRIKVLGTERNDRNSRGWTYFYFLLFYCCD